MKLVFFGTSSFAARLLSFLIDHNVEIAAIVTRPDRPKGRTLQMLSPPVKEMAEAKCPHIPLYQPVKASTPEFAEVLRSYSADLFLVVAYGEILRQHILDLPSKGCINVHASLLPKYRGAAPMQRALMAGEKESGITIIDMVQQMDAGDMIERLKVEIPDAMTFGELDEALYKLACEALVKTLDAFKKGRVIKTPQDHALATLAPKITTEEAEIKWDGEAQAIHDKIRALSPFPGAWCWVKVGGERKRFKIKRSSVVHKQAAAAGSSLSFGKEGWVVACGRDALRLQEVQLEGKKSMAVEEFVKGFPHPPSFV
jgi:methionyl-tRNA formyltransferase